MIEIERWREKGKLAEALNQKYMHNESDRGTD